MTAEHGAAKFEALASLSEAAQNELIRAAIVRSKIESERERARVIEVLPSAQSVYDEFAKPAQDSLAMELTLSIYMTTFRNPQITGAELIVKFVDKLMENEPYSQLEDPESFRIMMTYAATDLVPELRFEEELFRTMNEAVIIAHEQGLSPAEIFRDREAYIELMRRSLTPAEVKDKHRRYLKAFSRLHFQTAEFARDVFERAGDKFDEEDETILAKLKGNSAVSPKEFLTAYVQMMNEEIDEIWPQTLVSTS